MMGIMEKPITHMNHMKIRFVPQSAGPKQNKKSQANLTSVQQFTIHN